MTSLIVSLLQRNPEERRRFAIIGDLLAQQRVVRYLVGEAGIRQTIEIGTGIPAADTVHEVAQRMDPRHPGGLCPLEVAAHLGDAPAAAHAAIC